jgi:tetratricopeptide (TPR) repeat protein
MRARSLVAFVATVWIGIGGVRVAHADTKSEVAKQVKEAMASYDMMDYDAAKKGLESALATAKRAKLDHDPIVAQAYLDLGIVAFANSNTDAARAAFASAAKINPQIEIDPAYRSADIAKLLEQVRGEAGTAGGGDTSADLGPAVDCSVVQGLQHEVIDSAPAGRAQRVEALLAPSVKAVKVSVMYRPKGQTSFTEVQMTKQGEC